MRQTSDRHSSTKTPLAGIDLAIEIKIWDKDLMSGYTVFGRSRGSDYRQMLICYHIYPLQYHI